MSSGINVILPSKDFGENSITIALYKTEQFLNDNPVVYFSIIIAGILVLVLIIKSIVKNK